MSDEVDAFTYSAMRGMTTKELQEVQVKRLSAATQQQVNGGLMNSGMAGLLGAAGNAAQGMHAGAQNSILASNTAISNSPLVAKASVGPDRTYRSKVELSLNIIQAENGFIVHVGNHYGGLTDVHIAATLEDVNTIITSQLASRMLDRTE
jgi:hypothetical protein